MKLAESYGAKGIRVMSKDEIAPAFEEAKKNTKAPTIIEFIIDPEEMVYPMINGRNLRRYDYGLLGGRGKMEKGMKKRWISLYVENQVGVLSKISGLFAGKSYNLDSLTVGTTEDPTVSRMTIATVSDDETFEQIKKQLNRMVESHQSH